MTRRKIVPAKFNYLRFPKKRMEKMKLSKHDGRSADKSAKYFIAFGNLSRPRTSLCFITKSINNREITWPIFV